MKLIARESISAPSPMISLLHGEPTCLKRQSTGDPFWKPASESALVCLTLPILLTPKKRFCRL
jgi:hypothetical protein